MIKFSFWYMKTMMSYITGFATRIIRRVPIMDEELLTLPEHMSSSLVLVGFVLIDL